MEGDCPQAGEKGPTNLLSSHSPCSKQLRTRRNPDQKPPQEVSPGVESHPGTARLSDPGLNRRRPQLGRHPPHPPHPTGLLPRASAHGDYATLGALVSLMALCFKRQTQTLNKIPGTLCKMIQRETLMSLALKEKSKRTDTGGCGKGVCTKRSRDRHRWFTRLLKALELCDSTEFLISNVQLQKPIYTFLQWWIDK